MKSDQSIKGIVAAAIRRKSLDMDSWVGTRLWDSGDPAIKKELSLACELDPDELPILYSYIAPANWTLVTTRRIWYSVECQIGSATASDVTKHDLGNFKGYRNQKVEMMVISSRDGRVHHCPFETGKPSMGTIYAILTLCQLRSAA
ncbi:MAG: hypothetical protein AB7U82_19715 [Blastocatellales bacterium]